jgi:carboxypeptidase family protein
MAMILAGTLARCLVIVYVGVALLRGQNGARITGTVIDDTNARVPNTKITFVSNAIERTVLSDRLGKFEISLPPGVYSVRTDEDGFESERRAPIEVVGDSVIFLNLRLRIAMTEGAVSSGARKSHPIAEPTIDPRPDSL